MSAEAKPVKTKKQVFLSRLFSTLLMWALVTWVFLADAPVGFFLLLGLLAFAALVEILKMAGTQVPRAAFWLTLVLALGYMAAVRYGQTGGGLPEVAALGLLTLGGFTVAMRRAPAGAATLLEVLIPLCAFVVVPVMFFGANERLLFGVPGDAAVPGAWLVLWLVLTTKFSDMGAYITGSLVGKTKMIPHISPGKTWEGLVGGFAFTQMAGCGLYALAGDKLTVFSGWAEVVALGFVICAVAVVGDLAESVLKRSLVAKDSGASLPGIGGILDLIDSICFTAPVLWLWLGVRGMI